MPFSRKEKDSEWLKRYSIWEQKFHMGSEPSLQSLRLNNKINNQKIEKRFIEIERQLTDLTYEIHYLKSLNKSNQPASKVATTQATVPSSVKFTQSR